MRTIWALIVTSLITSSLSAAQPLNRTPAPGEYHKPAETAAMFKLPDGFRAQVFAGEPDIVQPIAYCIDKRGRLWVIENLSYPDWKPEGKDRVVILEDTDGDGVHDSRKVFWEGGNFATGIEIGYGGVFVGSPPNLLFIPDRNGDDKPDGEPEVLLDGWGHNDTHETINSFNWGPDGWLYGCQGVFTQSNVGKPGASSEERTPVNAAIWRYQPVTKKFEIFAEGGSNQWGIDFNDRGQAFMTACVIPHLYHIIEGGRYKRQAGNHFNPNTYTDIQTIRTHQHYAAAFAGAMVYLGDNFPESCRDQLFMNNIHASKVHMDLLTPKGSGYVGSLGPYDVDVKIGREIAPAEARGTGFVNSGDKWYRGLCLRTGPDGGVFVNDWYDQRPCHQLQPHDQDMDFHTGRVYKITYTKDGGPKAVSGLDLSKASNADLVAYQLHHNDWYCRMARKMLAERHAAGVDVSDARAALTKMLSHDDPTRRLRAMWALHVTGGVDEATTLKLLGDGDPYVRAWAIQLDAEDGTLSDAVLSKLGAMAQDDDSQVVRLYLASACQRISVEQRWPIVAALIAHGEDAEDHNLPSMYWYALEPMVGANKTKALMLVTKTKIPVLRQYIARRSAAGNAGPAKAEAPAEPKPVTVAPAASVSNDALVLRITPDDLGPAAQANDGARPSTIDVKGRKAIRFDGSDDFLAVPHSRELAFGEPDSFSASVWVYFAGSQGGWRGVLTKSRDDAPWWGLWVDPEGRWAFGGSGQNVAGTKATEGWHHVCLVQSGDAYQRIYVDGGLVGSGRAMNAGGSGDLWLGGAKSTSEFFNGALGEVRVYRRALSHPEVAYLAKNP